ncbi:AI-2E family transporter [Rhodococcus chondri]|uniref:AI-2E family transporter n=1 Tax=Rhodococcus chondri TaxID=3065941 RepID=A0ABU7JQC7_9NOCA|nr:AI-2E family transporter [Rhodococcus sp. CC-R104]MEE2032233.1 AI-2E family transporter [Rhodococcus sp. CC-R104]
MLPVPAPAASAPKWAMPRGVIVLLGGASLVIVLAAMRVFADVVGPVFLALILAVAVQPLPNALRRKGWPGWLVLPVALVALWGILGILVLALVVSIAQLATLLPEYSDKFDDLVDSVQSQLMSYGIGSDQVQQMLAQIDISKVTDLVGTILASTLAVFSNLVFLFALLWFMSVDAATYTWRLNTLNRIRPDIASAFALFSHGTRSYLVVSTVFGLIVAVIDAGALWLMGIPLPILWGLLSFVTNYIPNVGFVIGLIPPALLALLDGGPVLMLWVIAVYSVINVIIQSVIQPKFVGDAVGLTVTLTFLSLVLWTWVLGPLGAILAIPLTLFGKAMLVDIDPATRWAEVLLTSTSKFDVGAPVQDEPGGDALAAEPDDGASRDDSPTTVPPAHGGVHRRHPRTRGG